MFRGVIGILGVALSCSLAFAQEDIPGTFNVDVGLRSWRDGLREVNSPGIDVLFFGDSMPATGTYSRYQQSMFQYFKIGIQDELNPEGVPGGYGLITSNGGGPTLTYQSGNADGRGPLTLNQFTGPLDQVGGYNTNPVAQGVGLRHLGLAPNTSLAIVYAFPGADGDARARRSNVTSIEPIYRSYPGGGNFIVDLSPNALSARGAGTVSRTISTDSNLSYGVRAPKIFTGNRNVNWFAGIRGDSNPEAGLAFVDGAIFYDGDEMSGVRVHDVSNSGCSLKLWNDASWKCTVEDWGVGTPGRNLKLVIMSNLLLECVDPALTDSKWVDLISGRIRQIKRLPSRPSVLLMLHKWPQAWTPGTFQRSRYDSLAKLIYKVAGIEGAALLDVNEYASQNFPFTNFESYRASDFAHYSESGHIMVGRALMQMVLKKEL